MTRIISIAMSKGGTGKTTCAINIASGLARGIGNTGQKPPRVLLVDADPQANSTAVFLSPSFALGPSENEITVYEILVHQSPIENGVYSIDLPANTRHNLPAANLHLLPSHMRLARAELELLGVLRREDRMAAALRKVAANYDYIIIDCPPSLGILTLNALMASNEVIIPVEPGYFPLIGIGLVQQTIRDVSQINDLHLLGVIPTMQERTLESRETLSSLQQMFQNQVFPVIPDRVVVRNAHAAQADLFSYATDASGDDAVQAFIEVVKAVAHG